MQNKRNFGFGSNVITQPEFTQMNKLSNDNFAISHQMWYG